MIVTALGVDDKILPAIPSSNEAKSPKDKDDDKESSDSTCSCAAEDGKSKFSDTEAEQLIEFEDALHNTVYVKFVPISLISAKIQIENEMN